MHLFIYILDTVHVIKEQVGVGHLAQGCQLVRYAFGRCWFKLRTYQLILYLGEWQRFESNGLQTEWKQHSVCSGGEEGPWSLKQYYILHQTRENISGRKSRASFWHVFLTRTNSMTLCSLYYLYISNVPLEQLHCVAPFCFWKMEVQMPDPSQGRE